MMKKQLFTVVVLAISLSVHSQTVMTHVGDGAQIFVKKGTLYSNNGGFETRGSGYVENHGNFSIVGNGTTDVFRNLDLNGNFVAAGVPGSFVNKLNEPNNYNQNNSADSSIPPVYTYGQLYLDGFNNCTTNNCTYKPITGLVNQEFRQVNHGSYQQIAIPFQHKKYAELSTELGKTFTQARRSGNEILAYDNYYAQSPTVNINGATLEAGNGLNNDAAYVYYMLGGQSLDLTQTRTMIGIPHNSNQLLPLRYAGIHANFGTNGDGINEFNERYNSYIQDSFDASAGVWINNYGKNIYQFGNPYLTNLDLSQIASDESGSRSNDTYLQNIYGIRLEARNVVYNRGSGTQSNGIKFVTFDASTKKPVGDVDYMVIRPMGTFVIKLKDGSRSDNLNFAGLRTFNYSPNEKGSSVFSKSSSVKNLDTGTTVKQLGVIGLNSLGEEIAKTYYVVSPSTISGHTQQTTVQVANGEGSSFGTFEEDPINGGYDFANASYWLYINEANEYDFKGKNIKMVSYNPDIVSVKFEIRENGKLISDGTSSLSSGESFYFKNSNNEVVAVSQNQTLGIKPATLGGDSEFDLYYGKPASTLNSLDIHKSRTLVIYNATTNGYFVRFDPSWRSANVIVYDMSGRLVTDNKNVNTSYDFNLDLPNNNASYVVVMISDKGEKMTSKIIK